MKTLLKWAGRVGLGLVLVVMTVLLGVAFEARSLPELRNWHLAAPRSEFAASDAEPSYDFEDYLAQEAAVFEELAAWMLPEVPGVQQDRLLRYSEGGPSDPDQVMGPWNRTQVLPSQGTVKGAALLVHGLSDSPYSMRSLAEQLGNEGLSVVCLRLPGHGTVPAGLLDVTWRDWAEAVRVAAEAVGDLAGDGPFYLGGYSCGGALVVNETARALREGTGPVADQLLLCSPAIGITAFARASNWHKLFSWMPYFEKSRWLDVQPEFDPYKFNSFPKNAGAQMWELTQALQASLAELHADGRMGRFPPVLAFQSVVDATIIARDLVTHLFERLPRNGSELIAFDVNHVLFLDDFFKQDPRAGLERFFHGAPLDYRFTVVTNASEALHEVVALTRDPGSQGDQRVALGLAWPPGVYSLSHVAIPFPPDDPVYGSEGRPGGGLMLGALAPRGEKDVLAIPASQLLRLRFNPFHRAMVDRLDATLAAGR